MVRLGQQLRMELRQSPQQVLLSSLLQLPIMSLEQRIQMELEMNPLLEIDQEQEMDLEMEQEPEIELKLEDEKDEEALDEQEIGEIELEKEKEEIDWETILHDDSDYEVHLPREKGEEEENANVPVYQESLTDHLLTQLHVSELNPHEQLIGEYIIWNLDSSGYLTMDVETIAENLEEDVDLVEHVLSVIQEFDPPGIAARNLQECLLIQLHQQKPRNELAVRMIRDYFDDFKNKRFEKLAKNLEIDIEEVKEIYEAVTKLNPKPGEGYATNTNDYIVPDLEVRREGDEFKIIMQDFNIPPLRINNEYKKMLLDRKHTSKEARDFIRQRLESARWLINSIHQRRATILRTMEAIVNRQRDFFEKGPEHLKPMILKDIADDIGMDISTISRVTNGKYVQTEYGIFELKHFFSEKYTTEDGEDVSNKIIKNLIKEIVENEPPQKPYNDLKISQILKQKGYNVARRTIAKYREQMNIPVARLRRRI
ncbi:MAG: RNA polymerase factor sigma-54 [candidate division KSB1 bacterium]|nr:RNA polymerase factor sigma-54 [candidate division KSB1 bacterium]